MMERYSWSWVETQAAATGAAWSECAGRPMPDGPRYTTEEQCRREKAYDEALGAVERTLKRTRNRPGTAARRAAQDRVIQLFARFSAEALDLDDNAIKLLTDDFLPAGTRLARWARQFDAQLSMPDIIQACRNAWTACGLQPLLGERVGLTPSILGYSLLYPYSDNYLDREDVTSEAKLRQSRRFRERLRGNRPAANDDLEAALWALVELIEGQYPRERFPDVFDCLLAIHQAQEHSIAQVRCRCNDGELLALSCAKGGTSVLADACLARGWLSEEESRFAFDWGVLLQLGDDLQDVREDLRRSSTTLFSGVAAHGGQLDERVLQLLNFAQFVSGQMDALAHGTTTLKNLLRMSWRSLILMAVAESHIYFSAEFLEEAETYSPFRFAFLRERRRKLTGRRGLYVTLFDAMLAPVEGEAAGVHLPGAQSRASFGVSLELPPA